MALESGGLWRKVDWKARAARARELLERTGASIDPERLVGTLSMPEQQIVEIAKAIGANARIVIMDEPTASLTDREVDSLFQVIALLRGQGVGIIYISHRLEEISAIADRVTVLRDGQTIGTRQVAEVDRAELIRLMVGRELSAVFPKRDVPIGDVVLELRGLASSAAGIHDVSLSGEERRDSGTGGPGGIGPHATCGDDLRPDAGRWRRDSAARRSLSASTRPATRSRLESATCRRTGGSTAWCSRWRLRRTPAWRI